jgi:creatinine amidohydrolase
VKLADATWQEIDALDRGVVVLLPTGSLEQHGPHLPLFTDSIVVTAVAEAVERAASDAVLLTPTLWLGASTQHLGFAGSLSASFDGYIAALTSVVESLVPHGFTKFFVINGHGGNNDPNSIALRILKAGHPNLTFGHLAYYDFIREETAATLTGPQKYMAHASEAEASLIMHLRPDLVRHGKLRDDGLEPEPPLLGMIHHFDELTEEGSLGYATLATPEKGKALFEAAIAKVTAQVRVLADGYVLKGIAAGPQ